MLAASRDYVFSIAQADDVNAIIGNPDQEADGGEKAPSTPRPAPGGSDQIGGRPSSFPNDPGYRQLWHLKMHGTAYSDTTAPGASNFPYQWSRTPDASSVVVAVLDTGLVANHPDVDYANAIVPGFDFISEGAEVSNDGSPGYDADPTDPPNSALTTDCGGNGFHGTHVAGTVGAAITNNNTGISGGAWNVKIQPVRVLNKCGGGTLRDILLGLYWAAGIPIDGLPDNQTPAQIINLSLGGLSSDGCPAAFQRALEQIARKGILVIAAAGNEGSPASTAMPANCNDILTVAASDQRGHLTSFSNFGDIIDIMAPGGDINRDDDGDGQNDGVLSLVENGYARYNGTSMAAPMVAAAAAMLKVENPSLTPPDIRKLLKENAIPRDAAQCAKPCGAGLLNLDFVR
ncbi:MAG: S8 family serine peptidase [Pseudomonadota bacterium]